MENNNTNSSSVRRKEILARLEQQFDPDFANDLMSCLVRLERIDSGSNEEFDQRIDATIEVIARKMPVVRAKYAALTKDSNDPMEKLQILNFIIKSLKSDII